MPQVSREAMGINPIRSWSTQQYAEYLAHVAFNDPDRLALAMWEVTSQRVLTLLIMEMCSLIAYVGSMKSNPSNTDMSDDEKKKHHG